MPTNDSRTRKKNTTPEERRKIYEILNEVGVRKGGNFYEYRDDWTDAKVASKVAPNISEWSVRSIRQEFFGTIRASYSANSPELVDLIKRVEALENLILKM